MLATGSLGSITGRGANAVGRKLLWASLALAPVTFLLRWVFHADDTTLFIAAAAALVPLAWLIGEATEHAGEHTGPGIGGFLNASFGNAPELIIALFAVNASLPEVVRGSLAGSVVSNILLVLGAALIFGGGDARHGEPLDRFSLLLQLGLVTVAVLLFLVPSVPGWTGDTERHSLAVLSIPVSLALLFLYLGVTMWSLRRHKRLFEESGEEAAAGGWSLPVSLATLGAATVVTALISETLVHSLDSFAHSAGISEFFIAAVIVAIVGNAAEHGGAAHRGQLDRPKVQRERRRARRDHALGRPRPPLGRVLPGRRVRRRGGRILGSGQPLVLCAEDLGLARERVRRPVEPDDIAVLVADDT